MRALGMIVAMLLLLFGVLSGGCAIVTLADCLLVGIEGFGAAVFFMSLVTLTIAAGCVAGSVWLFRATARHDAARPSIPSAEDE